ncbi:hypothetical protein [Olivibacter sp. XZL3]|uniref:hypothetical protein n=1 Tax=Olivibacter sp. XZL3 TaxID=1735116 RepID=UPI001416FEE3|nr:hypothetical protein [Olivibacter sp. XZL3]
MERNKKQVSEQAKAGKENLKNKGQAPKRSEPAQKEKSSKGKDDLDDENSLKSNSLF